MNRYTVTLDNFAALWILTGPVGANGKLLFGSAEGLFEVSAAAAFLPTVAHAASGARVIEHPDVSGARFSGAGGEFL